MNNHESYCVVIEYKSGHTRVREIGCKAGQIQKIKDWCKAYLKGNDKIKYIKLMTIFLYNVDGDSSKGYHQDLIEKFEK